MMAGSQLVAALTTRSWRVAPTDAAREISWLRGQLVFDGQPLGDVVGGDEPLFDTKIVIDDAALADARDQRHLQARRRRRLRPRAVRTIGLARVDARSADAVQLSACRALNNNYCAAIRGSAPRSLAS